MPRAIVCSVLLVQLAGAPADARSLGTQDAPASAGTGASRLQEAKSLYSSGRFLESARIYESIGTPAALYNAGMARRAIRHNALALRDWEQYLASGSEISAEERVELSQDLAESRRATAQVRFTADAAAGERTLVLHAGMRGAEDDILVTWPPGQDTLSVYLDDVEVAGVWSAVLRSDQGATPAVSISVKSGERPVVPLMTRPAGPTRTPVRVHVGPEGAIGRGIEVTWSGPGPAPPPGKLTASVADWKLAPGRWTVKATARGYEPLERGVTVGGTALDVGLSLQRDRLRSARIGLGVGFGVVAAGLVAGGAAMYAVGSSRFEVAALDGTLDSESGANVRQYLRDIRLSSAGIATLAAAGGVSVAAITAGVGGREKALGIEAVLGLVAAGVGIPLFVRAAGCTRKIDIVPGGEPADEQLKGCAGSELPAAALLGLGVGMLSTASVALVTRRLLLKREKNTQVAVGGGLNGVSLTLRGRF